MTNKEIVSAVKDLLHQSIAQLDAIQDVESAPIETPVTPVTSEGYTKDQLEEAKIEAVAAFKAELKAKYEEQQKSESVTEADFASLLS